VRFKLFAVVALFLMTLGRSTPCSSQEPSPSQIPRINPPSPPQSDPGSEERAKIERDMAKKANQDRQSQLQRDADSLLKLATELKQYVDKTNEHTLSLDVIKKAGEIEKLAHSVKEKMKAN
jgi:hypothetical protein